MTEFTTPLDWKSEAWWRNRIPAERLFHINLPPKVQYNLDTVGRLWPFEGADRLLTGPHGSGKSLHAASIISDAVEHHGMSGRWVGADDYIDMLKDSFDNDGLLPEMYRTPHLVKYIKGVFDVVVIDGLGEERKTDFAVHELGSLIRQRYDRNKFIIITSSLSLVDIKNRYGARLATALADFDMEIVQRGR